MLSLRVQNSKKNHKRSKKNHKRNRKNHKESKMSHIKRHRMSGQLLHQEKWIEVKEL